MCVYQNWKFYPIYNWKISFVKKFHASGSQGVIQFLMTCAPIEGQWMGILGWNTMYNLLLVIFVKRKLESNKFMWL